MHSPYSAVKKTRPDLFRPGRSTRLARFFRVCSISALPPVRGGCRRARAPEGLWEGPPLRYGRSAGAVTSAHSGDIPNEDDGNSPSRGDASDGGTRAAYISSHPNRLFASWRGCSGSLPLLALGLLALLSQAVRQVQAVMGLYVSWFLLPWSLLLSSAIRFGRS
jgi:hypothetical protein